MKANLDFAAAREFMNYLENEGALCRITNAAGETVAQSSALIVTVRGKPAKGDATMQESAAKSLQEPSILTLAPHNIAEELPLHTPPPPPDGDYESGLSAAYSENAGEQDLGALEDASAISSAGLRLETLDGSSEEEQAKVPSSSTADASDVAAFLPPDMLEEKGLELDTAPSEGPAVPEATNRSAAAADDADDAKPQESSGARVSAVQVAQDSIAEDNAPAQPKTAPHKAVLAALSGSERLRFAVGVLLAVLIGYGVASAVASSREDSKYGPVIAELDAKYDTASTRVAWDSLDDARATALETLSVRRRGIVILSLFVWLVVAGLFSLLWLRVIDWSRWEEAVSDGPVLTPAPS